MLLLLSPPTRAAEDLANHHVVHRLQRLIHRLGDHHTLARRKAASLLGFGGSAGFDWYTQGVAEPMLHIL
jgi:hypothetical protein